MDKAKAYDEALERARKMLNKILDDKLLGFPDQIREIFPQLKESDDERIRKDIIDHFESIKSRALYDNQEESDNIISSCNEKIAYLEKQKEQKLVEWSEEDKKDLAHIIRILDDCYAFGRYDLSKTNHEKLVSKLKSLYPFLKSTEEQEEPEYYQHFDPDC